MMLYMNILPRMVMLFLIFIPENQMAFILTVKY